MQKSQRCPLCKKETSWKNNPFKPFCSERCRLIDLGNWASGKYTIPDKESKIPEKEEDEID